MNERIRELAEQAGVKMNAYGRPIPASLASNFDELALLIVRDCAEICLEANDHKNILRYYGYFGVEE
jgi:hypothetical protein